MSSEHPTCDLPLLAAIDLGTNACRLSVVRPVLRPGLPPTTEMVEAYSRSIRLGGGLGVTGKLSTQAMARALEVLYECAQRLHHYDGQSIIVRCVATAACRKASNCREFMQQIHEKTGLQFEVISIDEETRLAVLGCHGLFDTSKPYGIVIDIGGGSTEVIWTSLHPDRDPQILGWVSLPYGVVLLGDVLQRQDSWGSYLNAMKQFVFNRVKSFGDQHDILKHLEAENVHVVGTSGTLTTFASIERGLTHYDRSKVHGASLNQEQLHHLFAMLNGSSKDDRMGHPCIGVGRADLVMAGAAIFEGIYQALPASEVHVADRGVRDGVLFDLLMKIDVS